MDDAWYNAFIPSTQQINPKPAHRRRLSLLQQPNVSMASAQRYVASLTRPIQEDHADTLPPEDVSRHQDIPQAVWTPPDAPITRRTKSLSHFQVTPNQPSHHIIRHGGIDRYIRKRRRSRRRSQVEPEKQFSFDEWYGAIEDDLLDTSHAEYK